MADPSPRALTSDTPSSPPSSCPLLISPRQDDDEANSVNKAYHLQMELSRKAQDDAAKQMKEALDRQMVRTEHPLQLCVYIWNTRLPVPI